MFGKRKTAQSFFSSQAEWGKSHFKNESGGDWSCLVFIDDKQTISCNRRFQSGTGSSNLVSHLIKDHDMELPSNLIAKAKKRKSQQDQRKTVAITMMFARGKKNQVTQQELVTVAYCMNYSVPFATVDDPYWRAAFGSVLGGLHRKTLRSNVMEYAKKLRASCEGYLKGSITSIVADGGKDVCQNKLVAQGLMIGKQVVLHDMLNTELETLDAAWYCEKLVALVCYLEGLQCFVPSITQDNEASPNAGVMLAIESDPSTKHLLPFCCGAHTIELILEDISVALPELAEVLSQGKNISLAVKNHKVLLKALYNLQKQAGVAIPLKMVLSNNTRKWSTGYLTISRVIKLGNEITFLANQHNLPDIQVPDLAKMKIVHEFLFEFYLIEQILQRDISNSIHLSYFWNKLTGFVGTVFALLKSKKDPKADERHLVLAKQFAIRY